MRCSSPRIDSARRPVLASPALRASRGQRRVGRDLERLGRARVLGVLEHLLLATGSANQIEAGSWSKPRPARRGSPGHRVRPEAGCCPVPARSTGARHARRAAESPQGGCPARRGIDPWGSSRSAPEARPPEPARWRGPRSSTARSSALASQSRNSLSVLWCGMVPTEPGTEIGCPARPETTEIGGPI